MKKSFITMLILLIGSMTTLAQTSKAEKIKSIRAAYAKAKELIEKNKKNQSLSIVVHNQEEGDCPPVVTEINYGFNEWDDGQALPVSAL